MILSVNAQKMLLLLTRQALEHFIDTKDFLPYENLTMPNEIRAELELPTSAFVVLEMMPNQHRKAYIRGVNGVFERNQPIGKLITQIAVNAGFFDPHAPRIKPYELNEMKIHVLLPENRRLLVGDYAEIVSLYDESKEGVVLESRGRLAYALPHMWTDIPDAEKMLRMLRLQLGLKKNVNNDHIDYYSFAIETISED